MDHFCYYVSCLSCFLVCSLEPCGHPLRKGLPLGSLACDVFCVSSVLGQVWYFMIFVFLLTFTDKKFAFG